MTEMIALVVLTAIAAVLVFYFTRGGRSRHNELRRRFGPEYDRAVETYGRERAVRELAGRERRVRTLHIHELDESRQRQFGAAWRNVQARFVDDPSGAVTEADDLVKRVMRARGYPIEDFEQRVADLSVVYADVVQHYRAARALAAANLEGRANTEELRQAFVHYRALFAELLGRGQPVSARSSITEAHV